MPVLERLSEVFYEPALFWSLPLLLEGLRAVLRAARPPHGRSLAPAPDPQADR